MHCETARQRRGRRGLQLLLGCEVIFHDLCEKEDVDVLVGMCVSLWRYMFGRFIKDFLRG